MLLLFVLCCSSGCKVCTCYWQCFAFWILCLAMHKSRCCWPGLVTSPSESNIAASLCACVPQVEADIRPFRGILLGLFFVTTGSSLDLGLLFQQWPIVLALTGGLISVKVGIIGTVAPLFGLSKSVPSRQSCVAHLVHIACHIVHQMLLLSVSVYVLSL